ncbi:MAG TPA: hypothetical protein VM689_21605 [Aliidongia sp.]|nr:hypothetical protein [Aliidongia sp.]
MSSPRRSRRHWRNSLAGLAVLLLAGSARADPADQPVAKLGDQLISVASEGGDGSLPVFASHALNARLPGIKRVIVMIPGADRDAEKAEALGVAAAKQSTDILIVAPQFLDEADATQWQLSSDRLRWHGADWQFGAPSVATAPVGTFSALDALVRWLAAPELLPDLKQIVIAGRGASGALVQRYAVIGWGLNAVEARGIAIRYVVADAPNYLYLGASRPVPPGTACAEVDQWPYGLSGAPDYVTSRSLKGIDDRYRARDVRYLLTNAVTGIADNSCAAAAQGGSIVERGRFYLGALAVQAGAPVQRLAEIAEPGEIFASACGLAALTDQPGCPALDAPPTVTMPPPVATGGSTDGTPAGAVETPNPHAQSPPSAQPATGPALDSADPLGAADPISPQLTKPATSPPPDRPRSPG